LPPSGTVSWLLLHPQINELDDLGVADRHRWAAAGHSPAPDPQVNRGDDLRVVRIFLFLLVSRANGKHAAPPATVTVTDLVLPEGCAVTVTV
jgi:hypothetical protein